jgi:hypothetical protein
MVTLGEEAWAAGGAVERILGRPMQLLVCGEGYFQD